MDGTTLMTESEEELKSFLMKVKTQQWPQDWKRSIFIPIPKKGNAKECANYCAKVMTNLDSILKSRDITLPANVRLLKAMSFPVVMYG